MFAAVVCSAFLLGSSQMDLPTRVVRGTVSQGRGMAQATVTVVDRSGSRWETRTDDGGDYRVEIPGAVPPLLVATHEAGNGNCLRLDSPRARCMAALVPSLPEAGDVVANVNPLTDLVVSRVALAAGFPGPQQLVESGSSAKVVPAVLEKHRAECAAQWRGVFAEAGLSTDVDPLTTPAPADGRGIDGVFELLHHNRGYDRPTGQSGATVLTDLSFRPITGGEDEENLEPLRVKQNQKERWALAAAQVRVIIVGDSTAATYERARYPRMGWGQVFESRFKTAAKVKVQNAARAGRSSRDFFNGGWFAQAARFLRPGDYVLIQVGHNDQNCNASRPERGAADVANLCTYPNDATGAKQFPTGKPELSFQTNLERYIQLARSVGAVPVLLTPTARALTAEKKPGLPAAPSHVTVANPKKDQAFVGDYAQTVRDTAKADQVPLLEIEETSRALINRVGDPAWKDYFLVVDPTVFPYYRNHPAGSLDKPDTTHFQEKGAQAIADLVVQGIKAHPELRRLAALLK